jgi:hypothetical protein
MFKILFISIWFALHPVHVTLTSIDYVPDNDSFKVFVRMYFDDFLRDYRLSVGEIQEKGFSGENSSSKEEMQKYLSQKVVLTVNSKELSAKLQDLNLVDNEVSMNLVYRMNKKPRTLTVKNLIMTTLYTDQSNMLIVRVNNFEEGVKLTSDVYEQTFKIKQDKE